MSWFKRVPFHPFLFAVFPVLAFLGHNITEVSPNVIVRPLLVVLAGALFLFAIFRLVLRSSLRAGLILTLFLALFFTYGQVYNLLKEGSGILLSLARHRYLVVVYAVVLVAGVVLIMRSRGDLRVPNQALNLVGLVLLVFPLYQVVRYSLLTPVGENAAKKWTPQVKLSSAAAPKDRPDVYYIILDGYARADVIRHDLGYDNSPFLNQLRDMGFYVAECSRSNYASTHTSLNSSLNMEYLPTVFQWAAEQGLSPEEVVSFIKHSQVRKQFEALGYKIVAFDTGFEWTRWQDADLYLSHTTTPYGVQWITPFEKVLIDSTLLSIYTDWQEQNYRSQFSEQTHPKSYFINQELFKLAELPKIAQIEDPTFTFAHILIPHVPFVFSPEGILTDPGYFDGPLESPMNDQYFREGYIHEIQFDNQQMIRILTEILQDSSHPSNHCDPGRSRFQCKPSAQPECLLSPRGGQAEAVSYYHPGEYLPLDLRYLFWRFLRSPSRSEQPPGKRQPANARAWTRMQIGYLRWRSSSSEHPKTGANRFVQPMTRQCTADFKRG